MLSFAITTAKAEACIALELKLSIYKLQSSICHGAFKHVWQLLAARQLPVVGTRARGLQSLNLALEII